MKIRSLHPSFFSDAKVCRLTPPARLLFAGLWCYADDYGRGEWLPKSIEGAVFPRDVVDIQGLLNEVVTAGLVRLYTDGHDDFFEIPSWTDYQSPKYKTKTSTPNPETLENPYRTVPGRFGETFGQPALELSPGEGVERRGEGEGVVAPKPALDELKDTLVELLGEPPPQNWSLYNRVATWIRDRGGTPDEVRFKASRIADEWGVKALTVTSLEKHWTRYDAEVGQLSEEDVERYQTELRRLQRQKRAEELDAAERGLPG